MKKVNEEYELFKKMLAKEIGLDETDGRVPMLMSKLKRLEGKLHRLYLEDCNAGNDVKRDSLKFQTEAAVMVLMGKYKTIKTSFNADPRGGAIRFIFKKTGWINTLGSDVQIDW